MLYRLVLSAIMFGVFTACSDGSGEDARYIGFVDAFEDATLAQAREGFVQALKDNGYSEEEGSLKIRFRNAQGDIPALSQIVNFFITSRVDLIAANPTIATITAVQRTADIPVFMMVSGTPERMQLLDKEGNPPANLYGVGEELDYIDSSFLMIASVLKPSDRVLRIGMIYNQAEPQSVDALKRIQGLAEENKLEVIALPVNTSADAHLVTRSLLSRNIDAFFANPDNTVFAAFETIINQCNQAGVPVFSSEAGLVARGAVAAYGADIYEWGYQSGVFAARFLNEEIGEDEPKIQFVKERKAIYNPASAERFDIKIPEAYQSIE